MALLNCEECGHEVSSRAAACPHCGCPVPSNAAESATKASSPLPSAWTEPQVSDSVASPGPPKVAPKGSRLTKPILLVLGALILIALLRACDAAMPVQEDVPSVPSSLQSAAPNASPAPSGPTEVERTRWISQSADADVPPSTRLHAARSLVKHFGETPEGVKAQAMIAELEEAVAYDRIGRQWSYTSSEEGMSGKPVRHAAVQSTNTINLDFPYRGPQHATLRLRRHPRWGNDVILSIERGQILCHSYGDCRVQVRFDDGKLLRFNGNPPSDNSSEYVFIPAFTTFMKSLPKAKTVKIEVQIYQGGAPVFEFDVSGFKPEKFK